MLVFKSTILVLLAAVPLTTGMDLNFNYEVIPEETMMGTHMANDPASFSVEWRNLWTEERHPFSYPNGRNPHWSNIVLASHSESYSMWCNDCIATDGIELISEVGGTSTLLSELDDQEKKNTVLHFFSSSSPQGYVDNTKILTQDICVNKDYSFVSAISMIAPSPDWFTGLYNLPLATRRGRWYDQLSVYIFAWDAGTEEGDEFRFDNANTSPREGMTPFTAEGISKLFVSEDENGTPRVLPVGTLTFKRNTASTQCVETSKNATPETFVVKRGKREIELTCAWPKRRRRRCNVDTLNDDGSKGPKVSAHCPISCGK